MVRSMMIQATLLISFWGYALETTAHILNLVPSKKVLKTAFEMWKGKRPSLGHIKIWGCEVFVRREAQDKLKARFEKCLFVSYLEELFRYLFYKPKDNVVFVAQRGVFLEREMISKEDSVMSNLHVLTIAIDVLMGELTRRYGGMKFKLIILRFKKFNNFQTRFGTNRINGYLKTDEKAREA
ncbi:retrotransposon protein, putative, ty1-copia subclass [Tanacetum coccineum]|uniref:Retrotransposon protein, putative, ty1-copia subclass n=1 Tax=Tanacetum coccineum TaxID=301880 RepID=A0ABQ4XW13_9ASTR